MTIWTEKQKEEWNNLVSQSADGGFLQSWEWGEFNESLGNNVYRISNREKTILAQAIKLKAGNQWILSIPRGPVMLTDKKDQLFSFLEELKAFAKDQSSFLVRLDSPSDLSVSSQLHKSERERNPAHTLIIDTEKNTETLLEQMKSKHRYNIRLAEKNGVEVIMTRQSQRAQDFFALMEKTTARQAFAAYDQEYFESLMSILGETDHAAFLFALYEGKVIAGLLMGFFGSTAIYLHGASDYEYRKLMAPHLLQWHALKEAKRRKMSYDLWGVASDPPANKQEESWKGITRFKKGFAPNTDIVEYPGTYELPVQTLKYRLYKLRQKLRQK